MDELEQLVEAYNQAENDQRQRLIRIWNILKGRKDYREVRFGQDLWNNCWELDERLATQELVDKKIRLITGYDPGTE